MYSGSNNKIYTKTDCTQEELGETDVNCLYEIGGVKKALVDGQFIALEPNNNDPAYHLASDATKYYICFSGCNWHEATKYEGENKAYVVDEDIFIWYEGSWMNVLREDPFFYTLDETNVKIFYEYINGEWVVAMPFVQVLDAIETRNLYSLRDAVVIASAKKNTTITLLRDFSETVIPFSYTASNTTCTLDLNGHVAELQVTGSGTTAIYMLTLNGAGTTFTITDNTTEKKGELRLITSFTTENNTKRWAGIYLQNGSLVMANGKLHVENPIPYTKSTKLGYIEAILVASGKTLTVNGGTIEAKSAYNPYGIEAASGTPTINIDGGTIETIATTNDSPYGIIGYGTINIKGGEVRAIASGSSSSRGVSVSAGSSYQGTVNVTGGTIYAEATGSAQGIYCSGTATVTGDYNATTPNNTPKTRYYAKANISGGTITAICRTSTKSYGVLSYGTTTISGGTITSTVQKSNQNTAYGVYTAGGTTTISAGANITANAPTIAYGVTVTGANGDSNRGWPHVGVVNITGGTITANTTNTTTAYGLLVTGATWNINKTNDYSVFNGDYASAGTATVTGGTFNANAKTTLARGIAVGATKTLNDASATPKCTINGGYYKMTGTDDVLGCNASALAADFQINGGYYSHDGNLATYTPSPKHVLTLASGDANRPPYYYKVAEAYLVTFKNEDGTANIIDPVFQEVGTAPVCSTEPTKESTSTNSFTFDGWATEANGAKVYDPNGLPNVTSAGATYYAHFATTTLKYRVHFDAATNGGECATENIYVNPGTAIGSLPTATKYGYTFIGWFKAATGGTQLATTTVINADADYYAQFTANSHTLTWDLAGGTVSTAGKIGSTTWPAKNATGTPSKSVAFGTILTTIPVVAKTGYTFNRWDPVPTSSMPDEDVTYTALWNPNTNTAYTVKHYLQNVDGTYPADPVETQSLTGTTATSVTPDVKSYDGFVSPIAQTATIAADGSLVVEYQYARRHYTITLDAATNGGTSELPSIEVIHGATIGAVPPDAQKGCNDFTGWYTQPVGGVKITPEFVIEYDMKTLYAQFSDDVRTYPITYNAGANGTGAVAAGAKTCGEDATLSSSTFSRNGYTQTGWSLTDGGDQAYAPGGTYTTNASLTLYPVWTAVTYNLTYEGLNGATNSNPATYTIETASITLADPGTRAGYTFTGWTCGGSPITQITLGSTGDKTITANWSVVTYNLTYEGLNGATNSNPATYTIETATITLANPGTRAGYAFTGWTCGGTSITQIALGSTGDKTITANWEQTGVTILWKSEDGETILETDEGVEIGATPSFDSAEPTKATTEAYTYTFDGWATEANGEKVYEIDGLPAVSAAATYYAHFSATANVASVTVSGATTYYTTLQDAFTYAGNKTTPTITVLSNISLSAKVTFTGSKATTVTFELNGYKVSGAVDQLLYITGSKAFTFIIQDGSVGQTGQIYTKFSSNKASKCCVYVYYGTVELHSGKIYMENTNTGANVTAYGVLVRSGANYKFNMKGGKIEVHSTKNAYGIYTQGTTTVTDGEISVSETKNGYAAAVHVPSGTTTISDNPTFTISGTKYVNGVRVGGLTPKLNSKQTAVTRYNGVANIEGGKFTVTASSNTAYGVYCYGSTYSLNYATNSTVPGNYACAGTANVSGGEFAVTSSGETAYGVCLQEPVTIQTALDADGNATYDAATTQPKANITGGKFNVSGASSVGAVNTAVANNDLVVEGGWYNINTNLDGYTAPTKDCNFHVLPLTGEDPYMYEVAEAYTLSFNANGHGTAPAAQMVKNNQKATEPTAPTADGYDFDGWFTEAECSTAWEFSTNVVTANQTLFAKWTESSIGPELDIVNWTTDSLMLNLNGIPSAGWPYVINDVTYYKDQTTATAASSDKYRAADRTLTIPYSGSADEQLPIVVKKTGGDVYSSHTYTIPHVNNFTGVKEYSVVYVNSGTVTVGSDASVNAIYVAPGAELVVNSELTVNKLVLRTTEWNAAVLDNNGTLSAEHVYYTRQVSDAKFHQFALPLKVNSTADVFLSNNASCPYGNTWLLKSYSEYNRATQGTGTGISNWVELTKGDPISATVGYELYSGSAYYREFYFPVTIPEKLPTEVDVECTKPAGKDEKWYAANSGWNALCSPLMSKAVPVYQDAADGLKVSELTKNGNYWQYMPDTIYPAVPFYYQASDEGSLSFNTASTKLSAPRRAWNTSVPSQRLRLTIQNANGQMLDETNIFTHPERFVMDYETGYDVMKQTLAGGKALLYSELPCGKLAFAAVPDSIAEERIPITAYAATEGEYVFSMVENNYLGRLQYVFLHDIQTGLVVDLLERDYAVKLVQGTTAGRFYIQCVFVAEAPEISTGVNHLDTENDKAQKILYNDKVYIIYQGRVYDMTGRQCELR